MALKPPDYQLKLTLDLPDEQESNASALSAEEVRLRAETARQVLDGGQVWENGKRPAWYEQYMNLLIGGWDWRVAVYIAWAAQPRPYRWPKTQEELAQKVLGLTSDRQIVKWRMKNPAIQAMIQDVSAAAVFEALPDSFAAMNAVAARPDYKGRGDRELQYKLAGIISDKIEAEFKSGQDLSKLTWEEKLRLAGLDNPEALAAMKTKLAAERSMPSIEDSGEQDESGDAG